MKLLGANPTPTVAGMEKQAGIVNYFIGKDQTRWRTNIPTYGKVQYDGVYPGIDLVYYGTNQRQLEYDFVVAPGADPKQIALTFDGADKIEIDRNGDLTLTLPSPIKGEGAVAAPRPASGERVGVRGDSAHGEGAASTEPPVLRLKKPIVYQLIDGQRRDLDGSYVLRTDGDSPLLRGRKGDSPPSSLTPDTQVGFAVAAYDPALPLIIDPVLEYATYFGGTAQDAANAIAIDPAGRIYITGSTSSNDFPNRASHPQPFPNPPIIGPSYDASYNGGGDIFVAKFSTAGGLIYSTYLGGTGQDVGLSITADPNGQALVTGSTSSQSTFPLLNAVQSVYGGGTTDAFVTKLNSNGTVLVFSTFLGGTGADVGYGISVGPSPLVNAYVTGATSSDNFPTVKAHQASLGGGTDAFLTRYSSTGTSLNFSTYLGGSDTDEGFAIAVDSAGVAYITGYTRSINFPTFDSYQPAKASSGTGADTFVARLTNIGTLQSSTFLGGSNDDFGRGIAVDSGGNAFVTGSTRSSNFPTLNAYRGNKLGESDTDAFITKFNATASALVYSTFFGSSTDLFSNQNEDGRGIAVNGQGIAYITGTTNSAGEDSLGVIAFPTTQDAFDYTLNAGAGTGLVIGDDGFVGDAFVAGLSADGTSLVYSTYLGGDRDDRGNAIATFGDSIFVTGQTRSSDFPTVAPYQAALAIPSGPHTLSSLRDAFLVKFAPSCPTGAIADLSLTVTESPDPLVSPSPPTFTYTMTVLNKGPQTATSVKLIDILPSGTTFSSSTASQGSCTNASGVVTCTLGTLADEATATVTITVNLTDANQLRNRAAVTSSQCDPTPRDNKSHKLTLRVTAGQVFSTNVPGISCGPDCAHQYLLGTEVHLAVSPTQTKGIPQTQQCPIVGGVIRMLRDVQCGISTTNPQDGIFRGDFSEVVPIGQFLDKTFYSTMPNPSEDASVNVSISTSPPFSLIGPSTFSMEAGQTLEEAAGAGVQLRFTPTAVGAVTRQVTMQWSGEGAGPGYVTNVDITGVGAPAQYSLSMTTQGNGTITCSVGGNSVPCTNPFQDGTTVTVTASPSQGSYLSDWGGACNSTAATSLTCTVTMNQGQSVSATFSVIAATLSVSPSTINESGGSTTATFTITLSPPASANLTASYSVSGTATEGAGSDYTLTPDNPPHQVMIAQGQAQATITLTVINDSVVESNETATVTLTNVPGYALGSPISRSVTIVSDDGPTVIIEAIDNEATEAGTTPGMFRVTRTPVTASSLTVHLTRLGTAVGGGTDYVFSPVGLQITIPANQTQATKEVLPTDDTLSEFDETVILEIEPAADYMIGSPSQATVTIIDNDRPTVTIAPGSATASEGGAAGMLTVTRSVVTSAPLTVNFTVGPVNGAVAGDYTISPIGSVVIPGNAASAQISVTAVDDANIEPDEGVVVTLASPTADPYNMGLPNTSAVTLRSNDVALSVISAGSGSGTVTCEVDGQPAPCSAPFTIGTVVTLTQAANHGSVFMDWGGACNSTPPTSQTCTVTMNAAKNVKATFRALPVKKPKPSRTLPNR